MRAAMELRGVVCRLAVSILAIALTVTFMACGGGSGGSTTPPPAILVTITSHPAGVNAGLTYHFAATVLNTTNTAVSWKVACLATCTGADTGTISPDGTFTAPASVPVPVDLVVTATSAADSTKSGAAQFKLMPQIQISMDPAPSQIVLGFKRKFVANVQNDLDNRGVLWTVGGVPGGNANVGTIDGQGLYSAPFGSSEMMMGILATSVTDPTKTATANFALIVNTHPNFTGDYAISFSGPNGLGLTVAGGTIHLDGGGQLTATLDINSELNNNVLVPGVSVTGFYGFEHGNLGNAELSYTVGQQTATMSFRLALLSDQAARIMEFDTQGAGNGMIEKQAVSGLSTALDGVRVLRLSGLNITGQYNPEVNILGAFTGTSGTLSGMYDTPGFDQTPVTGSYSLGATNSLTLSFQGWNNGTPVTFRVYPVSSDKAFVISGGMPVLTGEIEKQSGGPYSLQAFSGTWVFSLKSTDSSSHLAGVRLVRMKADGSGVNAVGDMYDNNMYSPLDGPPYPVTFNQYHVAENGRGNANAQFAMPEPVVWYWVTPKRGYIMSSEGSGEFFQQENAPFSLASIQGTVSVVLNGFSDYFFMPKADGHLGTGTLDGTGGFVLTTSDVDIKDTAEPIKMDVTRSGTYTVDSEGRGVISLDGGQFVLRFYAASPENLLLLRPGYDVIGAGTAEKTSFPMN